MTAALPQLPPDATPLLVRSPGFTPEFELLLACCAESADERALLGTAPPHGLNWGRLPQLAQQHGVVPLVYPRLAAMDSSFRNSLPDLRALYEANARQTLWLTGELFRVLEHFEHCGVRAMPYKGPVLAEMLYGNVTMRQFVDLDLLISATDLPKIKTSLAELRYEPSLRLSPREERDHLRSGYEYAFDSPRGGNLLEIKWQILPRFYCVDFDVNGLFGRAAVVNVSGRAVRTLSHEDLVLVLCVHAAKHAWVQLSWLCDIARLANTRSLDWGSVSKHAKQLGIQRIVAVTFLLAHRLLAAPVPLPVQQFVQEDSAAEFTAEKVVPIIAGASECDTESAPYFRLMIEARERWQDRARFLWRLGSTPSVGEWSAIRLPGPLFPLYRAVRICRLARRLLQSSSRD
jgi:hypothetical protein